MSKQYDVCVLGLGPVGTISAACFAKQGFKVVGVDIDQARVDAFNAGKAPFCEPGVNELIQEVTADKRFVATLDAKKAISNSRIIMIAVGTPTPPESGEPDLSQLDNVSQTIGEAIKGQVDGGTIVVVRSTVPPGTMRKRMAKIIAAASDLQVGKDFFVASNPEFLREGKAIADFFHTGRIVIGADQTHVAASIEALYRDVIGERIHTTIEAAEFAKYVDNTWHALKVAFANEIGRVSQAFGGDPMETAKIFLADHQLNISEYYLKPGFAFGGSCLPKDVRGLRHLASRLGINIPVVNGILPSNEEQIDQGAKAVLATGAKKVGLLGVAFKENVDDLRESPALAVAALLKAAGIEVEAHDPAYNAGDELTLPGGMDEKLRMRELADLTQDSETLVLMHNTQDYRRITEVSEAKGVAVVDLTTTPVATANELDGNGNGESGVVTTFTAREKAA